MALTDHEVNEWLDEYACHFGELTDKDGLHSWTKKLQFGDVDYDCAMRSLRHMAGEWNQNRKPRSRDFKLYYQFQLERLKAVNGRRMPRDISEWVRLNRIKRNTIGAEIKTKFFGGPNCPKCEGEGFGYTIVNGKYYKHPCPGGGVEHWEWSSKFYAQNKKFNDPVKKAQHMINGWRNWNKEKEI